LAALSIRRRQAPSPVFERFVAVREFRGREQAPDCRSNMSIESEAKVVPIENACQAETSPSGGKKDIEGSVFLCHVGIIEKGHLRK